MATTTKKELVDRIVEGFSPAVGQKDETQGFAGHNAAVAVAAATSKAEGAQRNTCCCAYGVFDEYPPCYFAVHYRIISLILVFLTHTLLLSVIPTIYSFYFTLSRVFTNNIFIQVDHLSVNVYLSLQHLIHLLFYWGPL